MGVVALGNLIFFHRTFLFTEKIPLGGKCDFESGWCGWQNSGKAIMLWSHHNGPTPTEKTGPETDHTFQYTNNSGHYMFVNMNQHANDGEMKKLVGFASNAVMNSVVFNPPPQVHYNASSPYRNSCMVRNRRDRIPSNFLR